MVDPLDRCKPNKIIMIHKTTTKYYDLHLLLSCEKNKETEIYNKEDLHSLLPDGLSHKMMILSKYLKQK